ncbi:Ferredoxin-NADP reductase [Pseudoxanthobacter soli DSM 19599]|uniref:Ferredoxin-NADP reductase n=1 Tax=Pseudoxanthobacter soli DSM 19599 TaxID=1123029 RepID=A0A1M7ZHG1_9HYPH|nr:hybrid-cluster NAD(P)-dependent oxidoreductase [Pseudoxanthobacter soli]SHO64345.1 Ferredoxin-NADP reductase [Pseudoxanthobacter soli DSM 19599]
MADGAREPVAGLIAAVPGPWTGEDDDTLVCRAVRRETHDVATFVLAPAKPARFAYEPGQFLTFAFEIGGETIHRCYTVSSAPTRPDTVSITVKRVPGGPVSNWLHDTLKPGGTVRAVGPMGDFTCFRHPAERYLFLSGGSGITPLMSMARTFHDLGVPRDIVFVHNARTPADIVFRDELALMARAAPQSFRFTPVVEADAPGEPWGGFRGRVSQALLEQIAPDFRDREIFVCGPAPYMAAVRALLAEAGFDMARHHEESFDFAALSAGEAAEALAAEAIEDAPKAAPARVFRVEFAKTRRVIECPEDMPVLEAARRSGVRLPSSCTKGLCGTCKSKLVSGTVDLQHGGGIRQREIDAGMTLLCCAKPTSDLVVDR